MILPGTGRGTGEAGGGGAPRALRPEVMLWQQLRGGKTGLKVRRQHPIGPYIADFYNRDGALVIEIDGEAHSRGDRSATDRTRDEFLTENGYRVIRIGAADILRDVEAVAASIVSFAAAPLHHASHGPPPRSGED